MGEKINMNQCAAYIDDKKLNFNESVSLTAPMATISDESKKSFEGFITNVKCTLCKLWILIKKWLNRLQLHFKMHGIHNNHQPRKFRWKQTYKAIRLSSK